MPGPGAEPLLDRGPPGPPASLYVHLPFCRDRCTYCAFPTATDDPSAHAALIQGILSEARRSRFPTPLSTVYLGGGTPGLLPVGLLQRLLAGIRALGSLRDGAEITLEANPGNVSRETLRAWVDLGVNRVSVGVQTFHAPALRQLGRHDPPEAAHAALGLLRESWSGTWSADLLVGWVGQDAHRVERDVRELLAHRPPHVSVYGLTVEPQTSLAALRDLGRQVTAPLSLYPAFDDIWARILRDAGYERYEVSNFALPGHRSRHNQVYWANHAYLGLGPGATSYIHPHRWVNRAEVDGYLAALTSGLPLRASVEIVTPAERLLETLAAGLRTARGVATAELDRRFSPAWRTWLARSGRMLLRQELIRMDPKRVSIPLANLVRADAILYELARSAGAPEDETLHDNRIQEQPPL